MQRTATFNNRKIFMVSTPTLKGFSRIEKGFLEGDQRHFHVPCPYCGHLQVLRWSGVKFEKSQLTETYYECEKCQGQIKEHQKAAMFANGKWIALAPGNSSKVVSFHLSSLYSPFGWTSWADIAGEFVKVHKDPPRLQVWTNTKLAETWEDQSGEAIDPTGLMARREYFADRLHADICILTAGVDVQDDRLEIEIVGWGKDEESWSVDYVVLYGDPSTPHLWEDLDSVLSRTYSHARDVAQIGITGACVDSGGHYTDQVVEFCSKRIKRRVFAIKGSSSGFGVPIFPVRASQNRKLKKPVYVIGVNDAKQTIMQRLRIAEKGAGYCHFPLDRDAEYFAQLTSEVVKTRFVKGRPVREWKVRTDGQPTEGLDCRVYAFAALRGLMRNYKLDLNAVFEMMQGFPIIQQSNQLDVTHQVPNIKKTRVRSKGIAL